MVFSSTDLLLMSSLPTLMLIGPDVQTPASPHPVMGSSLATT